MRNSPNRNREIQVEGPAQSLGDVIAHLQSLGAEFTESREVGGNFSLRALVPGEIVPSLKRWLETYTPLRGAVVVVGAANDEDA